MKFLIITVILLSYNPLIYCQNIKYGQDLKKGYYQIYLSKNNSTIKIGDTIHINPPSGSQYVYISQNGMPAGPVLSNKNVVIKKIRVWKDNVYIGFKGYGVLVYIDYENGLEAGEISNPKGVLTKEQAINKLREAKEFLELELISQEEYDKLKADLSSIIMN